MPQYAPRRSADEWQSLIDQQRSSGLSARAFCDDQDIGYLSFLQWRKRLTAEADLPTFVEVTPDELSSAGALSDRAPSAVVIDLDLGDGLSLRISRSG